MIRKLLTCCLLAIFFSTSVVGNLAWAQSLPAEVVITAKRLNVRDDVGGSKLGAVLRGQQFDSRVPRKTGERSNLSQADWVGFHCSTHNLLLNTDLF